MGTAVGDALIGQVAVPRAWSRAALRGGLLAAAAVALSAVPVADRPHTLCLPRAVPAVPCPLCGSTTPAISVGHGDLPAALAAAPLTVLGAALLILAPL